MSSHVRLSFLAGLAGLLLGACGGSATPEATEPRGGEHVIRMDRPVEAGFRFREHRSVTSQQAQGTRVDGVQAQREEQKIEAEMVAVVHVVEVDERGRETRVKLEVESLTGRVNGQEVSMPPSGSVLLVERSRAGQRVQLGGGGELDRTQQAILQVVLQGQTTEGGAPQDAMLGTDRPRGVGERWSPDLELIADDFSEAGMSLDPSDMQGEVALEDVVSCPGRQDAQCLKVVTSFEADRASLPNLPPEAEVQDSGLKVRSVWWAPPDPSELPAREKAKVEMHLRASSVAQGRDVEHEFEMRSDVDRRFEQLP